MKEKKIDKWIKKGLDENDPEGRYRFGDVPVPVNTLLIEVTRSGSTTHPVEASARGFGASCEGSTVQEAISGLLESVAQLTRAEIQGS